MPRYLSVRGWVVGLCVMGFVACGGSGGGSGGATSPDDMDDSQSMPLELESPRLGVGFHHGEAGYLGLQQTESRMQAIESTRSAFDHAFLHLQSYDKQARTFGAWTVFQTPNNKRGATDFKQSPAQARLVPRTQDLVDEVQRSIGENAFEHVSIVVDFWRIKGDWYVRWDGNFARLEGVDDPREQYGFFLESMYQDLLEQIRRVADKHKPRYLVVGSDMERLLARDDGREGLSPSDFSNFRQFFRDVVREVDRVSPETRVGAGFNWDRFARQVAPLYGETERGNAPDEEALERAFENVLLPFAETGDVLALKSRRQESGDADYYDVLASFNESFDLPETPVLWYSIGSPVEIGSYRQQRVYLQNFLEWNAGVEVAAVAWNSLLNIDGAESGQIRDQSPCANLIEKFGLETSRCYDGLFETSFDKKETMQLIEEEISTSSEADSSSSSSGDGDAS